MQQQLTEIISKLYGSEITPILTRPEPQFGDFASNVALQLAKTLGKNPREVAEEVAEALRASGDYQEVSVAGPGFINIRLSDRALLDETSRLPALSRKGQTVVIETNNPNPFKAMHIGHAFNAILSDTIANLLEASGAQVHRVSYHGDVGSHVGKSMYSLLRFVDGDISKLLAVPEADRNAFMSRMYAEGSRAYKDDQVAKAEMDELAKQSFSLDDPLYKKVYEVCKSWSFEQIDELVSRLGNLPIETRYLESQADRVGVPIVRAHVPEVFQESDGALIFAGSKHGSFDNAFVTSRGLGLYGARDLGLMTLKQADFAPDKSYIVTAEEQRDYFRGVIAAAEMCLPELRGVTTNISTGTVKLSTGKMSSRSGDVIEVAWLFDQMSKAVCDRAAEPTEDIIAGALRYQFLKVRIGSDVVFDVNEAVSIQGNSGPYLQYAHARARSIIAKVSVEPEIADDYELDDRERLLVRKLGEYSEVVERAIGELAPHHICTYLFELAQEFNRFYESSRVVGSEHEAARVELVRRYAEVLRAGLALLGIDTPDSM